MIDRCALAALALGHAVVDIEVAGAAFALARSRPRAIGAECSAFSAQAVVLAADGPF
jgi:hypothetical protein